MRPTGQEVTTIEMIVCYSQFLRGGVAMPCGATRDSTRPSQEAKGVRGKGAQEALEWFLQEEPGKAGYARLELAFRYYL